MEIEVAQERPPELVDELVRVWEASVRATHAFLDEDAVAELRPEVAPGIAGVAQLAVAREGARRCGFAGVEDGKLEMLFVAPEARGRGIGRALLAWAVHDCGAAMLDVNEQNPQAVGFYEHEGFAVAGRSELDGAGRPFPLLHMALRQR